MNKNLAISIVAIVAMICALPRTADAAAESLDTRVTMVVGFPGTGADSASVTVVPGTVIPVSKDYQHQVNVDEESAEQVEE